VCVCVCVCVCERERERERERDGYDFGFASFAPQIWANVRERSTDEFRNFIYFAYFLF
jgi:hypothetical protein